MKAPCRKSHPCGMGRTLRLARIEDPPSLRWKQASLPPGLIRNIPDIEQAAGPTFYRIMGFHALENRRKCKR